MSHFASHHIYLNHNWACKMSQTVHQFTSICIQEILVCPFFFSHLSSPMCYILTTFLLQDVLYMLFLVTCLMGQNRSDTFSLNRINVTSLNCWNCIVCHFPTIVCLCFCCRVFLCYCLLLSLCVMSTGVQEYFWVALRMCCTGCRWSVVFRECVF